MIIIAGGKGERLRPLTDKTPKPMLKVDGKPILEHIINLFKKNGVNEFIITVCYLQSKITSYFGDGSKFGVSIKYIHENENKPLGTAGGIALAKNVINDTFIICSGDILRELDIKKMVAQHKKTKALVTLHVYERSGPNPKSMVVFDKKRWILEFVERPFGFAQGKPDRKHLGFQARFQAKSVWANGSFYVFEPNIFDFIPENKPCDFGRDIFPKLLKNKKRLFAFPYSKFFIDVGNMEKLKKARREFNMV